MSTVQSLFQVLFFQSSREANTGTGKGRKIKYKYNLVYTERPCI